MPISKLPLLASFSIESEQRFDVCVRNRPPERAAGHGRDNRLRTGGFVGRLRRPAHEDAAAARRVSRLGDGEGADDLHVAEVGALLRRVVTVRSTRDRLLERLEKILEQRRGPVQERQGHVARTGLRLELHHPVGIERPAVLGACSRASALSRFGSELEHVNRLAVDAELEPLPLVVGGNLVNRTGISRQLNANRVLTISWKGVAQHRAAARAERQAVQSIVLPKFGRDVIRLGDGIDCCRADRHTADLSRGAQIALHQRRRHPLHAGDVVEAVAHIIGRQHGGDVDVDRQQIADHVPIFGSIEPMQRFGAAGVGFRLRRAVE